MKNLVEELEGLDEMIRLNMAVDFECDNVPAKEFEYLSDLLREILKTPVPAMREYLRQQGYFVQNLWTDEDIIGQGENNGYEISKEQAVEIMDDMGRTFDACNGINWDSIDFAIEEYFKNQNPQ